MNNFQDRYNKVKKSGPKPSFQNRSWGVDRGYDNRDQGGEREMFQTTCSGCGNTCEVPFRPSGGRPVFCNSCFKDQKEDGFGQSGRSEFKSHAPKRDFNNSYSSPRPERSEYRPAPAAQAPAAGMSEDTKKIFIDLGFKLDRLIAAVEKLSEAKAEAPAKLAPKKVVTVKKTAKKAA